MATKDKMKIRPFRICVFFFHCARLDPRQQNNWEFENAAKWNICHLFDVKPSNWLYIILLMKSLLLPWFENDSFWISFIHLWRQNQLWCLGLSLVFCSFFARLCSHSCWSFILTSLSRPFWKNIFVCFAQYQR